jgi:iron complex outermembrane receptor protein
LTTGYNFAHASLSSNEVESSALRNQHALFFSGNYKPVDELVLYPSARYDYISDIGEGAFTYRFGTNYHPFASVGFGIRGNIGRNFRSPSFNDLYWKETGNSDLRPEESFNAEAGLFYSFASNIEGKLEVSYTYILAMNKIVWTPQGGGLWSPKNLAESVSKNLIVSSSFQKMLSSNVSVRLDAGAQFLDSRKTSESYPDDPTKDNLIPYVPEFSANINIGTEFYKFEINLFYSHLGSRYSDLTNRVSLSPVNTVDGNVGYELFIFGISSGLRLEINNLFDADYEVIPGYPMPLRNYRITFSIAY